MRGERTGSIGTQSEQPCCFDAPAWLLQSLACCSLNFVCQGASSAVHVRRYDAHLGVERDPVTREITRTAGSS